MRNILFRGKRVDSGEWVEGSHVEIKDGRCFIIPPKSGTFHKSPYIPYKYLIHPETFSQFIGKEIKGRKIFGGDIVFEEIEMDEGDKRTYFVVTWIEELSMFALLNTEGEYWDYMTTAFTSFEYFMESHFTMNELTIRGVEKMHYAGNIHDNPELLK